MSAKKPMALVILDGWGYREDNASNAIKQRKNSSYGRLVGKQSTYTNFGFWHGRRSTGWSNG